MAGVVSVQRDVLWAPWSHGGGVSSSILGSVGSGMGPSALQAWAEAL